MHPNKQFPAHCWGLSSSLGWDIYSCVWCLCAHCCCLTFSSVPSIVFANFKSIKRGCISAQSVEQRSWQVVWWPLDKLASVDSVQLLNHRSCILLLIGGWKSSSGAWKMENIAVMLVYSNSPCSITHKATQNLPGWLQKGFDTPPPSKFAEQMCRAADVKAMLLLARSDVGRLR